MPTFSSEFRVQNDVLSEGAVDSLLDGVDSFLRVFTVWLVTRESTCKADMNQ